MVLETDKTTEARRKALRKGEEDPVVVAQRFLNIYRQMHILSPERKEAFNKMLLDLSPEIRGLFSSLPGGAMLQDYADELAEKLGVQKSVHTTDSPTLSSEAHQQAQILASALAKAQAQGVPAGAPSAAVSSKISMDKDFAGEFAKIMGALVKEQTAIQKASLEKLALDISKTQLYIAKSMKEGREEQRQEIGYLCKTIAMGNKEGLSQQSKDIKELCNAIVESFQADREEHRQNINDLCKIIAQSQLAFSKSLSTSQNISSKSSATDDNSTHKLIEVVLDGQKQLNSRLEKVEELSKGKANDNTQIMQSFEKRQTQIIDSLKELCNLQNVQASSNEEKLLKIIGDSQEKLIKAVINSNIQNNTAQQANNNANNIQINTQDNTSQMILLLDKLSSLQASNAVALEKAITKTIEEQSKIYDQISRRQTKELSNVLSNILKSQDINNYQQTDDILSPDYKPEEAEQPEALIYAEDINNTNSFEQNINEDITDNDSAIYYSQDNEDLAPDPTITDNKADVVSDTDMLETDFAPTEQNLANEDSAKKKKKK